MSSSRSCASASWRLSMLVSSLSAGSGSRARCWSLPGGIGRLARLLDFPDGFQEIVVALPLSQQQGGFFHPGAIVEAQDARDFAGLNRRFLGPRLAAQHEDRGEARRVDLERAAHDRETLAAR